MYITASTAKSDRPATANLDGDILVVAEGSVMAIVSVTDTLRDQLTAIVRQWGCEAEGAATANPVCDHCGLAVERVPVPGDAGQHHWRHRDSASWWCAGTTIHAAVGGTQFAPAEVATFGDLAARALAMVTCDHCHQLVEPAPWGGQSHWRHTSGRWYCSLPNAGQHAEVDGTHMVPDELWPTTATEDA